MQISGTLTAYQIKDILEEPLWLEDTQLKSVSVIVPVRFSYTALHQEIDVHQQASLTLLDKHKKL